MDWKTFGTLPFAGGLMDQDPDVLRDLRFIEEIVKAYEQEQRDKQ